MIITYLLLGTNSGNREKSLSFARMELERVCGRILNTSGIYETEPWGFQSENNFYNQVLVMETGLPLEEFFKAIMNIEIQAGRIRNQEGYSDRTLDIDVLFFGEIITESKNITIPHPRLHLRKFALAPMAEIAPFHLHPVLKKTIIQLMEECEDDSRVTRIPV